MSIFKKSISLLSASADNIGSFVGGAVAGTLVLNGPLVLPNGQVSFGNADYASTITITAAADISDVLFTITGLNNGLLVTETLTGPNGLITLITTSNLFDLVINITISNNTIEDFTIGSGGFLAVVFKSYNARVNKSNINMKYNIVFNSLTAGGDWAAGDFVIYGVAEEPPLLLTIEKLTYATRSDKYFPLTDALVATTQASLNSGINIESNYPFSAIIVYIASGVNETASFLEISQS